MPILSWMGSKLDTSPIPCTRMVEKPFGIHPSHGSIDIHTFDPNWFNSNLRDHCGTKCRSSVGWARNSIVAPPFQAREWRRNLTESFRITNPRISMCLAWIGLIVIWGCIWAQNADPWPNGLETWSYSVYMNGGEAIWNSSESWIHWYPCFWLESV